MSSKEARLFEQIRSEPIIEQLKIGSLAATRVAAEYERLKLGTEGSEYWARNNRFLQEIIQVSPKHALQFANFLVNISGHIQYEADWTSRWLKGNGLYLLGDESLREELVFFLTTTKRGLSILHTLRHLIEMNIAGMDRKQVLSTPECYGKYAALRVLLNLKDQSDREDLSEVINLAEQELNQPETLRVLEYYDTIPHASYLIEDLKPHIKA